MWQTIGHEWAIEYLQHTLAASRIAHANLITGPDGIGKTHLAFELAAALNCRDEERPCGVCRDCTHVAHRTHPDVMVVEPDGGTLKIEQVRDLQYELALKPYEGRWRVCILTDFQTATTEAANALLKTLEEPPARAILLLTATDSSLLLPTIVSRCRAIPLRLVPIQTIEEALVQRFAVASGAAREIARLSAGRVGWAIRAAQEEDLLARRQADVDALLEVLPRGQAARIQVAEEISKRDDLVETVHHWQTLWRDVMLISAGCDDLVVNLGQLPALRELAERTGLERAGQAVARTQAMLEQLDHNVNARLAVETMLLSWGQS